MLTPERLAAIGREYGFGVMVEGTGHHCDTLWFDANPLSLMRAIEAEVRKDFADTLEAQDAEIARLNKAIHYEQSYLTRIGTHGPDCWKWGPQHYQCALAEIARIHSAAEIGKAPPCA